MSVEGGLSSFAYCGAGVYSAVHVDAVETGASERGRMVLYQPSQSRKVRVLAHGTSPVDQIPRLDMHTTGK